MLLPLQGMSPWKLWFSLMLCWFYCSTRLLLYHERLYWTSYVSFSWQFLRGIQLQLAGKILIPLTNSQFQICPSNIACTDFYQKKSKIKNNTKALKVRAFYHQLFIYINVSFTEALLIVNNVTAINNSDKNGIWKLQNQKIYDFFNYYWMFYFYVFKEDLCSNYVPSAVQCCYKAHKSEKCAWRDNSFIRM